MSILIGGSPSTGSSLLRRILNRHPDVFCGSESSLFCKPGLYSDWSKNKTRLLSKSYWGIKNAGWHHFIGLSLDDEYNLNKSELNSLIDKSNWFSEFIENLYEPILEKNDKIIWAEKTPSNVFCFNEFIDSFPEGQIVHIVRHPQDCIASLINRGMKLYQAVAVYLVNVNQALQLQDLSRLYTIKYEDLVVQPELTIKELFNFLDLEYFDSVLSGDDIPLGSDYMEGWNYRESGTVGSASMGRFKKLDSLEQSRINSYIYYMSTDVAGNKINIRSLSEAFGYNLEDITAKPEFLRKLKLERKLDILNRICKGAYFNTKNYPIYVRT